MVPHTKTQGLVQVRPESWRRGTQTLQSLRYVSAAALCTPKPPPLTPSPRTFPPRAPRREFEQSGNVAAARSLMQQGLRMCKHEEVMWSEYLRMELLYIQRLRVRRQVLGLDVPGPEGDAGAEAAAGIVADAEKVKGAEDSAEAEGGEAEAEAKAEGAETEAAVRAVLTGAVARIVFKNAVAAIPGSLRLRKAMLAVLADFSFHGTRVG